MGTGSAPTPSESYRISKDYKDPERSIFVSMGSTHEERVKNYTSYLDSLTDSPVTQSSSSSSHSFDLKEHYSTYSEYVRDVDSGFGYSEIDEW